jgi:NADH:ubiquinone oxidoreductase subunit E
MKTVPDRRRASLFMLKLAQRYTIYFHNYAPDPNSIAAVFDLAASVSKSLINFYAPIKYPYAALR